MAVSPSHSHAGPERRRDGRRSTSMRLDTLLRARWYLYLGQVACLFLLAQISYPGLSPTYYQGALAAIGVGVCISFLMQYRLKPLWQISVREGLQQFGFDVVQITVFLFFAGGVQNPIALLYLAPVALSAMVMEAREATIILLLGIFFSGILAIFSETSGISGAVGYLSSAQAMAWYALSFGMFFGWAIALRIASQIRMRSDALVAMQTALADEQRLAALGALSTAAAHELGTPLGTITLAAREVMNDMKEDDPYREEMAVIAQEALRCREILKRLSSTHADEREDLLRRLPVEALVQQAIDKHEIADREIIVKLAPADGNTQDQPMVSNRPEIIHGIGNFIENAVGFSREKVEVLISWDEDQLRISVLDDGPGFDASVVDRLGEPYISTRAEADALGDEPGADASGAGGLGLGVFIAKTLIERTGGEVSFHNGLMGGAQIDMIWNRDVFDHIGRGQEPGSSGGFPEELQS